MMEQNRQNIHVSFGRIIFSTTARSILISVSSGSTSLCELAPKKIRELYQSISSKSRHPSFKKKKKDSNLSSNGHTLRNTHLRLNNASSHKTFFFLFNLSVTYSCLCTHDTFTALPTNMCRPSATQV